jgi:hypothetical protein
MHDMSSGVVYVATSERFVEDAVASARSVARTTPSLSTGIITSEYWRSELIERDAIFDDYVITEDIYDDIRDKCFNIRAAPYDRNLYLDTDTCVCEDISEMFELLDSFDFAAAHAPVRESNRIESIPDCFPDFNGGVILFRDNQVVDSVLRDWKQYYMTQINSESVQNPTHDQATLRRALFESDARIATLPPEYNCRFIFPGYVEENVKILHGSDRDLADLCKKINSVDGFRLHTGQLDREVIYQRDGPLKYLPGFSIKKQQYPTGKWRHRIQWLVKKLVDA